MIAFVSLFLGLVTGTYAVELVVSGAVEEVEVRLDGETVGVLTGEPWRLACDFGDVLTTHELLAIARDGRGVEVDRAVQWLNVPRPLVETEILLDDWSSGQPGTARLIWSSVLPSEPVSMALDLDGEAVAPGPNGSFKLPRRDPGTVHFLRAELEFDGGLSASSEAVFGGRFGSATETELTAVPLAIEKKGLRRPDRLQGLLVKDGAALRVVALDEGPSEVVVVRDQRALESLRLLQYELRTLATSSQRSPYVDKEGTVRVLSPRPERHLRPEITYLVFTLTQAFAPQDGSLPSVLAEIDFGDKPRHSARLADAVATAGLKAAASRTRRAVVLVTSDCTRISGQWSAETVRAFLAELHVPLRVWTVADPADPAAAEGFCPIAEEISDPRKYYAAIKRLRRTLNSQYVAWVEGHHLPRTIAVAEGVDGLSLAD